ncbi:MASE4 domain-containing protein [Bradyrhizobium erythrophlei]|uniref:histidine kinase n=1 Tax=Bradyrhizobium erythrophlei TaxID=1437360 RepID=A0A1H4YZ84_9BRAD|nr:MASE4 domain-containing protein [Bradyrhizobium erythrophlei]SED22668.1 PAS domain S-box-containing protein [Bradyrhizobium erythrophlei]
MNERAPTDAETSLLSLPPTDRQTRWAIAVAACQVVAFALVAPFARAQLAEISAFVPAFEGVIFVTDLVTSVLLFSQFAIYRLRALLVLACGYLFSALMIIPHALTFPGAFSPTGLLGAGLQTTASLYWFWHLLFPMALLGYGLLRNEESDPGPVEPSLLAVVVGSCALVLALVCGLTLLATAGNNYLPVLFADRVGFTPEARLAAATTMLLSASAVAVLWLRRRSLLDQWLIIVALAALLEMALGSIFVSGRFSLGFYAGRLFSLFTSTIVLVVLLVETMRFHAHVARSKERKIRRLVDANILGICIANLEGAIIEANEAFLRMVQYSREDVVSRRLRWTDLTPAEWREQNERSVAELHSTGAFQPVEKEYFRKNGSRVPVLVGGALFEKSGNEGVIFALDLTERKRAEEALRRDEAWLAQAQRLSHIGTWVLDGTTKHFLYWSDESYHIWGFDPLRGLPSQGDMWERVHPDDRERVWGEVQEALREKRDFLAEFKILLPDGTVKYLEGNTHHEFSRLGALLEVICTNVDVTERKRAQDERERLRQLEADLAHINRVSIMGEMAASLSHEILQPIATARNNARAGMRFLEMNPPNLSEVREALGCVVRDADRAKDIVGRIRSQIKRAPPQKERFDLHEAINEVIVMVRSAIAKNAISVNTRLMDGLVPVQGDRVQLQQVLVNLILNAVEAMSSIEDGTRELSIRTEQSQTGGILVAVHDSGPGVDPVNLERVFEPFYTTKTSGIGMGLSICQTIINGHGGRLWMSANEPRGAVFQFTLPAVQENL